MSIIEMDSKVKELRELRRMLTACGCWASLVCMSAFLVWEVDFNAGLPPLTKNPLDLPRQDSTSKRLTIIAQCLKAKTLSRKPGKISSRKT